MIHSRIFTWFWLVVTLLVLPTGAALMLDRAASAAPASARRTQFFEAASQAAEFIGYSRSIELTAAQRTLRDRALSSIPAACCEKFSAATCCCPCNLARSVWGLTNYLIVRQGADVPGIRRAVRDWLDFVNPRGFSGDACDTGGGCNRRFSNNGCGGMDERNLQAAR